jgi:acetyl esterase
VLSIEYALAPEHPFPAAVQDCWCALRWLYDNAERLRIDPKRVAVGGDSAGGNLATGVARLARDRGGLMPCFQVLLYPLTDFSNLDTGSYREFGVGHYLTRRGVEWFRKQYVPNPDDYAKVEVSPLLAADMRGLPSALVVTAECDVLRDEGRAYAERLAEAGVRVLYENHEGMIHGFFSMWGFLDGGRRGMLRVTELLRGALRG